MKTTIQLILFLLFFAGCNRPKSTEVNGHLLIKNTNIGIDDANIILYDGSYEATSMLSGGYRIDTIEITQTNNKGYFKFNVELNKKDTYYLSVSGIDPYWYYGLPNRPWQSASQELTIEDVGGTNYFKIYATPKTSSSFLK